MNLDDLLKSIREEDDDSKGGKDLDDLLESIRSEEETPRKTLENKLGKDVVSKLSDDQIKKLSEYYNSLPPKEREKTDKEIAKNRGEFFDIARGMAGIKFVELNEDEKQKFTPDAVEVEQGPMLPPEEVGGDVYSPRKKFNTSKFFDNDEYDDFYKELVDEGSIDDQNLSKEERQRGIAAFRSNKLDFKKFVLDIQSLKPEVEQLNQEPLIIKEQFFTAPKIEPSKLIPNKDVEISEEFNEKLDELISVIRKDNQLEEERLKLENLDDEREKRKKREERIENKKQTKSFLSNLKKSTGSLGGIFDKLKRFLTFTLLGGVLSTLYNFIMDPKNDAMIKAVQGFLKDWWPAFAAGIAFILTPFKGLIAGTIKFLASTTLKILKLFATNPIFAIAVGAGVAGVMDYLKGEQRKSKLKKEVRELMDKEDISETEARKRLIEQKEKEKEEIGFTANPLDERVQELRKEMEQLKNIGFERSKYGFNPIGDAVNRAPGFEKELTYNQEPGTGAGQFPSLKQFSGGAMVTADSGSTGMSMGTDKVHSLLTPGEIVFSRPSVSYWGADRLLAMNKIGGGTNRPKVGKVMGYQGGGFVGGGLFGEAPLTKAARAAGYQDKELAAFLAQMAHETGNFQFKRELSGGASHYGGGGPYTLPNGKVVPAKYHGRGYIQLTHDYNYKKYGDRLGVDLLNNPELALDGDIAARIAVEYWKDHVRPTVKGDWDNVFLHSKAINLPSATSPSQVRGMSDRQKKYDQYLKKILSQKPSQIMPAMPTAPGSLGPAFSDNTSMKDLSKQQLLRDRSSSIRSKLSNPLETFVFTPLRRALGVGTPNIPTETRNFMMPPVETPKQNQSSNQTGDIPVFNISSGNRMRDLVSKDLGINDLVGASS